MGTLLRLAGFLAGLAAVFAAALGAGALTPALVATGGTGDPHEMPGTGHADEAASTAGDETPGGLLVSDAGFTLRLQEDTLEPGTRTLSFSIAGPDGSPVTDYARDHEKELHLIAVRRDLTGFQHVHPRLGADGEWSVLLTLTPGAWRVFADFRPDGRDEGLTLGADLLVPGDLTPRELPRPAATATVDGYRVRLDGSLKAGSRSALGFTVTRAGEPVTDLQPYLGAYGHLVALRHGDLAYLHVHPAGEPGDGSTRPGPDVGFFATAPSPGDYRLFLDFRHGGQVHTAEFTVRAGQGPVDEGGRAHGH